MIISIPNYPGFVDISHKHKNYIDGVYKDFLPYCDFTFSNLYVWQTSNFKTRLSILNGNLITKTKNIRTGKMEISLIGKNNIEQTVITLLSHHNEISFVPGQLMESIHNIGEIIVSEDIDNHDYIISTRATSELKGKQFLSKRKRVNRFKREHPNHSLVLFDTCDKDKLGKAIHSVYKKWRHSKQKGFKYIESEWIALQNFISIIDTINAEVWGLEVDGDIKAFTTIEYINNDYAISSFAKGDLNYKDVNVFLTYKMSEYLFREKNIKYINHEQDLGLLNLRMEKLSWKPSFLLKKYSIKKYE